MICRDTPIHGWVVWWVSGSMGGSGEITNCLINLDLINCLNNSILFEDLLFVETPHPWVGTWVVGWMGDSVGQWVGSDRMTKY